MCECGWCGECASQKEFEDYVLNNDYEDGREAMRKEIEERERRDREGDWRKE